MENDDNINNITNININNINNTKEIDLCEEQKKSIEALILYRSLYILKKKFESRKEIIRKIYNSFNLDSNSNVAKYFSYQVSINNFDIIAKIVFEKCNIILTILNNPKNILLSNLFLNLNKKIEEMTEIFKEIKEYILDEKNSLVKKYNILYYEKKIKTKMIKDIIETKQNKNKIEEKEEEEKKRENEEFVNVEEKNEIKEDIKEDIKEEIYEKDLIYEEEEIQRKIVEYNRKGKIIKTYNKTTNDNLTLIMKEENLKNEKLKQIRFNQKEKYFKLNEIKKENTPKKLININNNDDNKYNIKIPKIYNIAYLIDIENGKNYNNIIYIETLPLIIADFIQQFPYYCILETEDDLNEELNILFDKELIEKMNSYEETLKIKNEKIINKEYQNYLIRKNKLENNIKIYENLINEKKLKGENTSYLEDMLEKSLMNNILVQNKLKELKTQNKTLLSSTSENELNEINTNNKEIYKRNDNNIENNFDSSNISNISKTLNKSSHTNSKILNNLIKNKSKLNLVRTKMIRKAKLDTNINFDKNIVTNKTNKSDNSTKIISSIKEIFTFYSKQHNSIGAKLLFADLEKNMEQIGCSEFYKFCEEFTLPITRLKSNDIFKKALTLSTQPYHKLRLMNFDEFLIALKLLAKEINNNKIELLKKNIEIEKKKLNELEEKQKKKKELEKYNNSININLGNVNNKKIFDKSDFYYQCEKKKFTNEIFNLENKYNTEKEKDEEEVLNNFLNYLGINSKNDYKKRLKGFLLPFQIHDKKKSITKVKNGIGSKLESEIIEASKMFALQKEEKMKISLSKELMKKRSEFEEKKRMFKIKNDKLIKDIIKNENKKYSDKLIDLKKELVRRKNEKIEMQKKEEYERKNIISWNRLENFSINNLDIDEIERICNDSNNSDEEIINKLSDTNQKFKKTIPKNKSSYQLMNKNNNLQFPIISKKTNIEKEIDNKNNNFNNF